MKLLVNLDVEDLAEAEAFYTRALALRPGRRLGPDVLEMLGAEVPIYLLAKAAGSPGAPGSIRDYARHWTPIHLDFVVDELDVSLDRALAAGAILERGPDTHVWGRIAVCSDPFGHGFCLIQFLNRGYDELVEPA